MKVCKTIEEFLKEFINNNISFDDLSFENDLMYSDLLDYCKHYENDDICTLIIGLIYYKGKNCEVNYNESFKWFLKSAELGNTIGMNNVGVSYERGEGCTKNINLAFYWYTLSAKQGYYKAQFNLGTCYKKGKGVPKDDVKAVYWCTLAAKQGHVKAQYNLALCYYNGDGVPKDNEKAIYWWTKAAEQSHAKAQYYLGYCYKNGFGVPIDSKKAVYWWTLSADKGYALAQSSLALCYLTGYGISKDKEKAIYWWTKTAEQGDFNIQFLIASMYDKESGIYQNKEKAIYWYTKAAEQGHVIAQHNLGILYFDGDRVSKNTEKAIYWWTKAAEQGYSHAQYNLGICYQLGQGCEKDLQKALEFYKKALDNGFERAREEYENLLITFNKENNLKYDLHFTTREDVFISWNHLDIEIKNKLSDYLESQNICTVWESDGHGVGEINNTIQEAILQSRSYIILLTGNSIKSKWVAKEIEIILEKVKSNNNYKNVICPIIIDTIYENNKNQTFNVINEISKMPNDSPYKELLNYCSSFTDLEIGIDYEKISNSIKEAINNSIKIEYKDKIKNKFNTFSAQLYSHISSKDTKIGILASSLDFEKSYLNRNIYDENQNSFNSSILFNKNTPSLIYGEGGSGKSLYLKNLIKTEFNDKNYFFYLECKGLSELLDSDTYSFSKILKLKSFDIYFADEEANFVTQKSFEDFIINNGQNIVLLIDALDELLLEKRRNLINKLQVFLNIAPNCKIIFTTRNKYDATLITSIINTEIDIYKLQGLSLDEIKILYDNLSSRYKLDDNKNNKHDINTRLFYDFSSTKDSFFRQLDNVAEDIKKNPLLISNLIFIYFATHKIPSTSFDIITESVTLLLNDLEEERNIRFHYKEYILNDKLYKLLGYFAIQRSHGNMKPTPDIIKEYLKKNYHDDSNYEVIAESIYKYLRSRAIIVNENISHEIFKNYFAAVFIFNKIYEFTEDELSEIYIQFKDNDQKYLESWCEKKFKFTNEIWNNIAVDLLYKLDFEIFNLNRDKNMNENHLSYDTFNKTLIQALKEHGFNKDIIDAISKLISIESFHYNDFIKKYL